jgi:hypothetical protein
MAWSSVNGVSSCRATVSAEDSDKRSRFESLGFRAAGSGGEFNMVGKRVASIHLALDV